MSTVSSFDLLARARDLVSSYWRKLKSTWYLHHTKFTSFFALHVELFHVTNKSVDPLEVSTVSWDIKPWINLYDQQYFLKAGTVRIEAGINRTFSWKNTSPETHCFWRDDQARWQQPPRAASLNERWYASGATEGVMRWSHGLDLLKERCNRRTVTTVYCGKEKPVVMMFVFIHLVVTRSVALTLYPVLYLSWSS
jgi:hypothetical protein